MEVMTSCNVPLAGLMLAVPAGVTCMRTDVRHVTDGVGSHQAWVEMPANERRDVWQRLVSWSPSGASASNGNLGCSDCIESKAYRSQRTHPRSAHRYEPCVDCGDLYDCATAEPARCSMCAFWAERLAQFTSQQPVAPGRRGQPVLVRPEGSDNLYSWSPGSTGGFSGRRFVVTVDTADGEQTFGPGDSLWSGGIIPTWLREAFEPNGTIIQG